MFLKFIAAMVLMACAGAPAWADPANFDLDPAHTYPSFEINHLGFSIMRGSFLSTTGTLVYDEATRTGTVKATIDAASISTGFAKRDEHLRSKDFFNVERYPTLSFVSEPFTLDADKAASVAGTLTLLGVSKPVSLGVQLTKCANRMDKNYVCGAKVTSAIKRSDWGLSAYVPFVGDDVAIQIEVEATRK